MSEKEPFIREQTVCFTGHRAVPEEIVREIRKKTGSAVARAYENGYRTFLCGGARGFDTIAAQEVLQLRQSFPEVKLAIAVPCSSQADRWPPKDQKTYRCILEQADRVIVLSDKYYQGCMQSRNRFMVDNASLCLCYMTRFEGGTWYTVRYALHQGVMLKNIALDDDTSAVMKEHAWNSIYTSLSAKENANTVHLSRLQPTARKKTSILKYSLKKRE